MLHGSLVAVRAGLRHFKEVYMRKVASLAVLLLAMVILLSGCATRDWVRDLLGKKEVEIGERVDKVSGRVDEQGVQVKTLEGSLGDVRGRSDAALAKADGAFAKADGAFAKADGVDSRLSRLWGNRHKRKVADSMDVYFGFDQAELSDGTQTALLGLVKELQSNPGTTVELGGFTDPKGSRDYNYQLSQRRVEAVRRFLIEQGVEITRILSVGLGPLADRGVPDEKKRRVTVRLMVDQD
jgi:outer membrane protein OmpA-like peptidoglycan-associated protein